MHQANIHILEREDHVFKSLQAAIALIGSGSSEATQENQTLLNFILGEYRDCRTLLRTSIEKMDRRNIPNKLPAAA